MCLPRVCVAIMHVFASRLSVSFSVDVCQGARMHVNVFVSQYTYSNPTPFVAVTEEEQEDIEEEEEEVSMSVSVRVCTSVCS